MVKTARRKTKSWKRYQSDTQKRKSLYLGLLVLGVIISVVLIGKFLSFVGALGQPFSPDGTFTKRDYLWNGNSPINVVVKSSQLGIISFNPASESLTVIKVPDEVMIPTALGYGRWPARSIYDLGQSEDNIGAQLLKLTFSSAIGAPIDGYIIFKGETGEKGVDTIIEDLRASPVSMLSILGGIKTDLSLMEVIRLMNEIRGVRFDKVNTLDLAQSQNTSWILLSDGSRALEINYSLLDKTVSPYLEDESLSLEGVSVAVYNSTEHPGLAEKASRMIANMGGRVVLTSVIEPSQDKSVIIGSPSYSYTRLGQIFAPNCLKAKSMLSLFNSSGCEEAVEKLKSENSFLDTAADSAQVTIVLGEDYYNLYNR